SLLIDRIAPAPVDEHAIVDAPDQAVQRGLPRPGFEPYVGHALERHRGPAIGLAASVRFLLTGEVRLLARGLKALEDALVDNRPLHGFDAVVVIADRGERARRRPVADESAVLACDPLTDFVERDVTGPGIVGLITQGPVELRR